MKKKVYSLLDEEQKLIYEETKDEKGNLLYYIDYQADPIAEKYFEYDEAGNMTSERDVEGGIETSRTETEYKDGKVVSIKLYISQELYEETKVEYNEEGQINTSYIYGDEVRKVIYKTTTNGSEELSYVGGELEYKLVTVDGIQSKKEMEYNEDEELITTLEYTFNQLGYITKVQLYDQNRKLLNETISTFENNEVVKSEHTDYMDDRNNYIEKLAYDYRKNLIKSELIYTNLNRIEFTSKKFDAQNRLIEETGLIRLHEHVYTTYFEGVGFHLFHEYE